MYRNYFVYIMANKKNGVLYIGVTSDLQQRVWQHKSIVDNKKFTSKYHVHKLVYFEQMENVMSAIEREKQLKKWNKN